MIKTILFDLDGTLLPMNEELFTKAYFGELAKKLIPHGYEKDNLISAIWKGTAAMINNNGEKTNEEVFWNTFVNILGSKVLKDKKIFEEFYANEFDKAKNTCTPTRDAVNIIRTLKDKGYNLVISSNPIFPLIAQEKRITWAGLKPEDFSYITSYENSHYTKPNKKYFEEILKKLKLKPEDCLVVGNDVTEDMVAAETGVKVFLLTNCLVNKNEKDYSKYMQGNFKALLNYIKLL